MVVPTALVAVALSTVIIGTAGCGAPRATGPLWTPAGPPVPERGAIVFPTGTEIPFRFLHEIVGGRDRAGAVLYVQTLGALARDSCVIAPPYRAVRGRITESHRGGWFGRRGELTLRFDSLELAPGVFAPLDAVADSLEYGPPAAIGDSGRIYGGRPHAAGRVATTAAARQGLLLAGLSVLPAAALEGYLLFHRATPVRLEAGEMGRLRLLAPLSLPEPAGCVHAARHPDLVARSLPKFVPRTANRAGTGAGDPINFVFLGTLGALDTAFARAGWERTHAHTTGAVAREVVAALRGHRAAVGAPVSTEYFAGRIQDAAYELPGPTAKVRHHLRVWRLDDAPGVIVGSGNEDVGLTVNPLHGRATHRVDPDLDRERNYVVTQLEAGGCADLLGFVKLPGAVTEVRTLTGQQLRTDGRAAVVRLRGCGRPV